MKAHLVGPQSEVGNGEPDRKLIVKRIELMFNEKECQVLNFTDITAYVRLKEQEETNRLLKAINVFVHHEMLAPLQANVDISERLVKRLKKFHVEKKLAETIFISSKMVMMLKTINTVEQKMDTINTYSLFLAKVDIALEVFPKL